ncbi:hypothetical protein G4Y79_19755 [Phototrophicus methaneseepsis]|uniref:Uncharacterized protein n=1 Tax=Phototrophicus methaneseepsis TaxID=2710758 RepID=A0A7S8IDU3_9CHLR|nr:hypothetical protein [Phototrophicus methaneseepsis]QPC81901.1 hypothetical protein G4Y79_19755 [Phototrophicus methaneseepsis]
MMKRHKSAPRISNLAIAGISALTGCIALFIAFSALSLGLWIDGMIGQRGPATICLLVVSVPFSLFIMIRIALGLISKLGHKHDQPTHEVVQTVEDEVPIAVPLEHKEE